MHNIVPKPTSMSFTAENFTVSSRTKICIQKGNSEVASIGSLFSDYLQQATGHKPILVEGKPDENAESIQLTLNDDPDLGEEGYELRVTNEGVFLRANCPAGLFYGVQTFRQFLPLEHCERVLLPGVIIRDMPRFAWRGAMLDVARHFFSVADVQCYIDSISSYKLNRLHLHLSDDQGWRIEIKSWPNLTLIGAQTQVGGGGGGYYTQEQYREIVDYARSRYVTIVPEIDTPGHTNAALASYPELNSTEEASDLYEGINVGFSTLWINSEITYQFLDDVVRELAALTPTPYIHVGGDEAKCTPEEEYKKFIKRMQAIVISHGKIAIGWGEIGAAEVLPGTITQHWVGATYQDAQRQGSKIILSPANRTYLDMKYEASSPLGLDWAGLISVKDAYDWEPGTYMNGLEESDILGIEAPLWTETVRTIQDIEYMAFPRIIGLAELAWSPKGQNWEEYRQRLAAHGKRLEAMGINFFRSPDVDWQ